MTWTKIGWSLKISNQLRYQVEEDTICCEAS